ncbi:MAG: serine/threonine-protein kinase [Lautropia sp.]
MSADPPVPTRSPGMEMTLPPGAVAASGVLASGGTALPAGTRMGEFEIVETIGEGGFGIVYRATDHLLGRQVALKEYMPTALAARVAFGRVEVRSPRQAETFEAGRRSFVNEARLLAQFDHPALVKVFRFWEDNGTAYMVMPFYRGRTLRQALADLGEPPAQPWLSGLLLPLMDALETLHAVQCYHRDVAPDNIMLLDNGKPVLLDFGAARRVISDASQALTVILKPGFAPVEQYANGPEMRQGPWTDVYALAAVIYYCATRQTPVPAISRMMKDTLVPFAEAAAGRFDPTFCRGVDQGLAVAVDARPQSIAAFRAALGLDAMPAIAPTGTAAASPWPSAAAASPASEFDFSDLAGFDGGDRTVIDPDAARRATAAAAAASARRDTPSTGLTGFVGPAGAPPGPAAPWEPAAAAPWQPPAAPAPAWPPMMTAIGDSPRAGDGGFDVDRFGAAAAEPQAVPPAKPWTPNADVQAARAGADAARPPVRRDGRGWLPIAAGVAAVAVAGGVAWYLIAGPQTPQPAAGAPSPAAAPAASAVAAAPATAAPSGPGGLDVSGVAGVSGSTGATGGSGGPAIPATTVAPVEASNARAAPDPLAAAAPRLDPAPVTIPSMVPQTAPPPAGGSDAAGAAAGASSFQVGRLLELLYQGRDPNWPVTVQLASNRVRIGRERLRFRIRSERDGYAYLLMHGTDNAHFYQLFPNALDRNNRLRGNVELALPRASWEMVAGGPPGTNRLILLVTPSPRDFSGAGLGASQPFGEFDLAAASRVFTDRGAAPFAGDPTGCTLAPSACAPYGAAMFEIEEY